MPPDNGIANSMNTAIDLTLPLEMPYSNELIQENVAIDARTDAEAAAIWLRAKGSRSVNTFNSYRREAIRLLLWLREQQITLRDLKVNHVHQFYSHLANPPQHWLRPRKPRHDETLLPTQVLVTMMNNDSIDYTRTVLGQMCAYLQDAGYMQRNVFRLSIKPPVIIRTTPTRVLDLDSWQWLWSWTLNLPQTKPAEAARCRWLLVLLYNTGIRREEAAHGLMGDFTRKDRAWSLRVIGKGNKERFVTVNSTLLQELVIYRKSLKLEDFPVPGEQFPLVASVNGMRRSRLLTPRTIGLIVANIGKEAESVCEDEYIRVQIKQMTTHWMRHTNATHRLLAGAALETTQDELGHSDPRTTRIYAKVANKRRQEDAEKLSELSSKR